MSFVSQLKSIAVIPILYQITVVRILSAKNALSWVKWECSDIGLQPGEADRLQVTGDFSGTVLQAGLFLGD